MEANKNPDLLLATVDGQKIIGVYNSPNLATVDGQKVILIGGAKNVKGAPKKKWRAKKGSPRKTGVNKTSGGGAKCTRGGAHDQRYATEQRYNPNATPNKTSHISHSLQHHPQSCLKNQAAKNCQAKVSYKECIGWSETIQHIMTGMDSSPMMRCC